MYTATFHYTIYRVHYITHEVTSRPSELNDSILTISNVDTLAAVHVIFPTYVACVICRTLVKDMTYPHEILYMKHDCCPALIHR